MSELLGEEESAEMRKLHWVAGEEAMMAARALPAIDNKGNSLVESPWLIGCLFALMFLAGIGVGGELVLHGWLW